MKGSVKALIPILFIVLISQAAYADRMLNAKDITVRCAVDPEFGMEVEREELVQHLPDVFPGGSASGKIHIRARSNRALPWAIWASSSGLAGESKGNNDILPVTISTYGDSNGFSGASAQEVELSDMPKTIYQCGEGDSDIMVKCMFSVMTKPATREDVYTGKIILTLTE